MHCGGPVRDESTRKSSSKLPFRCVCHVSELLVIIIIIIIIVYITLNALPSGFLVNPVNGRFLFIALLERIVCVNSRVSFAAHNGARRNHYEVTVANLDVSFSNFYCFFLPLKQRTHCTCLLAIYNFVFYLVVLS